jgi:heme exporter protein D
MSNWAYVGLAYGITYTVLITYVLTLLRKKSQAQQALEEPGK